MLLLILAVTACTGSNASPSQGGSGRMGVAHTPVSSAPFGSYVGTKDVPCRASELALSRPREGPSEATGQNSRMLALTNRSSTTCSLDGYPTIALIDEGGKRLPFRYRNGGDQMVTARPPAVVTLAPGSSAYALINKYRCDVRDRSIVASITLTPPGDLASLRLPLRGYPIIAYCGPGDLGSIVDISPVESGPAATLRSTDP
jgi:hypothetical protein